MFSQLRARVGTAGLFVAVVALVAALAGGAYAASGVLTGKEKKEVKAIAKKYAGKPGATGAPGAAGAQGQPGAKGDAGANGTNGTDGTNGTNGKDGVSPKGAQFSGAKGPCTSGGVEFEEAGGAHTFACNGSTGFTSTLPSGQTETGTWTIGTTSTTGGGPGEGSREGSLAAVSFAIPLEAGLDAAHVHYISTSGQEVVFVAEGIEIKEAKEQDQAVPNPCPGTAEAPEAEPGHLCVYEGKLEGPHIGSNSIGTPGNFIAPYPGFNGAGPSGAILNAIWLTPPSSASYGYGSWAVTAP